MVLVAAPFHRIVAAKGPLTQARIERHRAVSIADASRLLPPRTVGLFSGQDVLTVPSLEAKVAAHVAGLGVGFLPRWIAEPLVHAGRLKIRDVDVPRLPAVDIVALWLSPLGYSLSLF